MTATLMVEAMVKMMSGVVYDYLNETERQIADVLIFDGFLDVADDGVMQSAAPEGIPGVCCETCGTEITEEFNGRCPALGVLHT